MNRLGDAPTDLLFGLIALHNDLVAPAVIPAALRARADEPGRTLADLLVAGGALTPAQRELVESLSHEYIERHGGDAGKSLASLLEGPSARDRLDRLGDCELSESFTAPAWLGSTVAREGGGAHADVAGAHADVAAPHGGGQRFRVLRPHAVGGLGEVFVALDVELNREVALKRMKGRHADDPTSRQRFLVEAEITGGLEHPGIVPVYGLGAYADGRPYYAMRFIKGESLKEAIQRFHGDAAWAGDPAARSLAYRKLLRGFTDVCNAVDYAHDRGVPHRDIKPGNIIVGKHGETLVVDWGLAKPLGRAETDRTGGEGVLIPSSASGSAETLPGSALGTPAYMSPEQAGGELDRLGPRSDVYSLGATLYALLTGRPPFEGEDARELLSRVRRGDFAPPRSLDATIDPALEAVCLKAMSPEPADRYATSRELGEDVERWMADEPVTAWREPLSSRARRWARRHRTAVTALAASVLVAMAGTGVVLAVQTRANGRLQRANEELARANDREKHRFDLAMEAIGLFHGEVGDDLVLKAEPFRPLRDKLLRGAAAFYGKLEGLLRGQSDRASREEMGRAYFELGALTATIGDKPAALAVHLKGLEVRRGLASETHSAEVAGDVAESLIGAGILFSDTGQPAEALARFDEARGLLEGLPGAGTGSERRRALLGRAHLLSGLMLANTGDTAAARTAYGRAVQILERPADADPSATQSRVYLSDSYNNIGALEWEIGRPAEALESHRRALGIRTKLAEEYPAVAEYQDRLANTFNSIGIAQEHLGRPAEALESYRRALAIQQRLADGNPAVTAFQSRLAASHINIGALLAEAGRGTEALESYRRALAIEQKLADDNPAVAKFRSEAADSLTNIGLLLLENGQAAEAVAEFLREASIRTRLVRENPSVRYYGYALANCLNNTAGALLRLGRPSEARARCEQAMGLLEPLVKDHPETAAYRVGLAESRLRSGMARRDEGDTAGAAADCRRADALLEAIGATNPEVTVLHACCHASLSWAADRPGSGVSAGDSDAEAAKAMTLLRRAAEMGFRDLATYRNETGLDPLRDRSEFRMLMLDLAFPGEPLAPDS